METDRSVLAEKIGFLAVLTVLILLAGNEQLSAGLKLLAG